LACQTEWATVTRYEVPLPRLKDLESWLYLHVWYRHWASLHGSILDTIGEICLLPNHCDLLWLGAPVVVNHLPSAGVPPRMT